LFFKPALVISVSLLNGLRRRFTDFGKPLPIVAPDLPAARPRTTNLRAILNAIF
jgi:hypothetical protein